VVDYYKNNRTYMTLIKKTSYYSETKDIEKDLRYAFNKLINQDKFPVKHNKTLSITITHTNSKHLQDLRYKLTNLLFNRLHRDYKNSLEHINYLYVIEYSEVVSKGQYVPKKCDIHTHIIINTSIPKDTIEYYSNNVFPTESHKPLEELVKVEDITNRSDKYNYINYLLKQKHLFTTDNYNYKILLY
jgi:hypothetical protein